MSSVRYFCLFGRLTSNCGLQPQPSSWFRILLATGSAFPLAAEAIIPFIRSEAPHQRTSVFAISRADDVIYSSSPERLLDLLVAVVGDAPAGSAYGLSKALELQGHAPQLASTRKFQRLLALASVT